MDNPFDEFDQPAAGASPAPAANPFDEFDATPKDLLGRPLASPPPESKDSSWSRAVTGMWDEAKRTSREAASHAGESLTGAFTSVDHPPDEGFLKGYAREVASAPGKVGKFFTGVGEAAYVPVSPFIGAAKSLLGRPLAHAIHKTGEIIAPEIAAKHTPEDVYETIRPDVETALGAQMPAKAGAPPRPKLFSRDIQHPEIVAERASQANELKNDATLKAHGLSDADIASGSAEAKSALAERLRQEAPQSPTVERPGLKVGDRTIKMLPPDYAPEGTPGRGPEKYVLRDPLGAARDGETMGVQILRDKDGKIEAFVTDHGVHKIAPAYREMPAEQAIAETFGDHRQGSPANTSNVTKEATPGRASLSAAATPGEGPLAGVSKEALDLLREDVGASHTPHTAAQRLEEMSPHQTLGEFSPNTQDSMSGLSTINGPAKNEIVGVLRQRMKEVKDRLRSVFDRGFGEAKNTSALEAELQREKNRESSPYWQKFKDTPIPPTASLDVLNKRIQKSDPGVWKYAEQQLEREGVPTSAEHYRLDGEKVQSPTAAFYEVVREGFDKELTKLIENNAPQAEVRRLTLLKKNLTDAIDNHPDQNVSGLWKKGREISGAYEQRKSAMNLGQRIMTNNVKDYEVPELTGRLTPEQKGDVLIGIRRWLEDQISTKTGTGLRSVEQVLTDSARNKISHFLGEEKADSLFRELEHERDMIHANQKIIGGSETGNRVQAAQRFKETPGNLAKAAEFLRHPIRGATAEGLEHIQGKLDARQQAKFQAIREELGRLYTLQGPERDSVIRYLLGGDEGGALPAGPAPRGPAGPAASPLASVTGSEPRPAEFRSEMRAVNVIESTLEERQSNRPDVRFEIPENKFIPGTRDKYGLKESPFIGELTANIGNDLDGTRVLKVSGGSSFVKEQFRRQGHGLALYEKAIAWAQERGLKFRSDASVSTDAEQIYSALERRGYTVERREGKQGTIYRVSGAPASEGRKWLENNISKPAVGQPDRQIASALQEVPELKQRWNDLPKADQDVLGEFMGAVRSVAAKRQISVEDGIPYQGDRFNKAPLKQSTPPLQGEVFDAVRKAYNDIAQNQPHEWVSLTQLRKKLGDFGRSEVDSALQKLGRSQEATLVPDSNQKTLSNTDRASALKLGGEDKHLVSIKKQEPAQQFDDVAAHAWLEPDQELQRASALLPKLAEIAERNPDLAEPLTRAMQSVEEAAAQRGIGEPEAFHGSPHTFDAFDASKTNEGIWLTKDAKHAGNYTHGDNGTLYGVKIKTAIKNFLDRGKPIDQQSQSVQKAIDDIKNNLGLKLSKDASGTYFYAALSRHLADDGNALSGVRKANEMLREKGIPGLTSDAQSFVVFDDSILQITHKNGKPIASQTKRASGGRVMPSAIERNPTEAQKEAGNYAKEHLSLHGLDFTIENAKGHERSGVGKDGKRWSVKMPAHYGYVKRTLGKDGDHVDIYLGQHKKSPHVWVIDQQNAETKSFDEHKAFIGFASKQQVIETYRKAFSDGKADQRLGHIHEMSIGAFKHWLENGDTTKPIAKEAEKTKLPHSAVGYVSKSNVRGERCSACSMFISAGPSCTLVANQIQSGGWCRRFDLRKGNS